MALCWAVYPCNFCTGDPRTEHSNPGVDSPIEQKVEQKDHLSWLSGDTLPNAAQRSVGFHCGKGTLLMHIQHGVHKLHGPQHVLVNGLISHQVQDFLLLDLLEFLSPHFSNLFGWQYDSLAYQSFTPVCVTNIWDHKKYIILRCQELSQWIDEKFSSFPSQSNFHQRNNKLKPNILQDPLTGHWN